MFKDFIGRLIYRLKKIGNIHRSVIIKRDVVVDFTTRIGPWSVLDGEGGKIIIGKNCSINAHSWLGAGVSKVIIGDDVRMGSGVKISCAAHNFDSVAAPIREQGIKPGVDIVIEDDCWLGMNVVVCPGVKIGRGSVIGAGAVVVKDIPPFSVAVGVPAKVIKSRAK